MLVASDIFVNDNENKISLGYLQKIIVEKILIKTN